MQTRGHAWHPFALTGTKIRPLVLMGWLSQRNVWLSRAPLDSLIITRTEPFKGVTCFYIGSSTKPHWGFVSDLKTNFLFSEKKKHHVDRCKIMRGAQKWHPFGLKIYDKSSKNRFEHNRFRFPESILSVF